MHPPVLSEVRIGIVGLGYVGLPLAVYLARYFPVVGFDIDASRVDELAHGIDRTREVTEEEFAAAEKLSYSADIADLRACNFFIVTVPTPVDQAKRPDLSALVSASRTVGQVLSPGDVVVYESTVFPGATEEVCVPELEKASGLKFNRDFFAGYSPERINPGDLTHRLPDIIKVTSGSTPEAANLVNAVYARVITAGTHRASSIRVAEAAKVIENIQRDVNIALINELAMLFKELGLETREVLEAAGTKWNFQPFRPGLVGGHCIGVDPYYLTYRAEKAGYDPQVILAGRRINDGVGQRVARECVRRLLKRRIGAGVVTVLGMTFKENVPDTRNTKVADIVSELQSFGLTVQVHDPLADPSAVKHEYGIELMQLEALRPADAVIFAVAHESFVQGGWPLVTKLLGEGGGIVLDVKSQLDRRQRPERIELWRL